MRFRSCEQVQRNIESITFLKYILYSLLHGESLGQLNVALEIIMPCEALH